MIFCHEGDLKHEAPHACSDDSCDASTIVQKASAPGPSLPMINGSDVADKICICP